MRFRAVLCVALALVVAVLAGCSSNESSDAGPPESQTVTQVVTQEPVTVTEESPAPTPAPEPASSGQPPANSDSIRVPDVVGIDHQLAQDTMQAAGLYVLAEEDATGRGRLLLWDRNWVVVSQDPPAGTLVSADTRITLYSKKDGE